MVNKIVFLSCVFLTSMQTKAFVRRDVSTPAPGANILESFQKNLDEFRKCLDQTLANSVKEVNEKQLKPALDQIGDSLNRVSKAFDDLTAPPSPKTAST